MAIQANSKTGKTITMKYFLIVFCIVFFISGCKKDPNSAGINPNIFEPIKDTCYNIPCATALACYREPVNKRLYLYSVFDPGNSSIVYSLYNDSSYYSVTQSTHRWLKTNLITGDTSSIPIATRCNPELDKNGWMYYMEVGGFGSIIKSKTDGSSVTDLKFPSFPYSQPEKLYLKNDGTQLMVLTEQLELVLITTNGQVLSRHFTSEYLTNATFMCISPDFNFLLFQTGVVGDSISIMDIKTKQIVHRINTNAKIIHNGDTRISNDNNLIIGTDLLSSNDIGGLTVCNLHEQTCKQIQGDCLNRQYTSYRFSQDNKQIITAYTSNEIWDAAGGFIRYGKYSSIMDIDGKNEHRFKAN